MSEKTDIKISPELQEAYNECVIKLLEKKRCCSEKCKICHPDRTAEATVR